MEARHREQVLRQFGPRCLTCGGMATWELGDELRAEWRVTSGPYVWTFIYPHPPQGVVRPRYVVEEQGRALADSWVAGLLEDPELASFVVLPPSVEHRTRFQRVFYCDEHVHPYEGHVSELPLASLVRSLGSSSGVSSEGYPTRFERDIL